MAKFIDKKERVYDIKLTTYGRYLLSVGEFKPSFYAFFDRNIIYDGAHANLTESQSSIIHRIKNETQYIESLVLFDEIEDPLKHAAVTDSDFDADGDGEIVTSGEDPETGYYFTGDVTSVMRVPRKNTFKYNLSIGDSFLDGEQQLAPAWKVISLNGVISGSALNDIKNNISNIPQINISLDYKKQIENYDPSGQYLNQDIRNSIGVSKRFSDEKVVRFIAEDLLLYGEELNTDILTENFDIEVFQINKDAISHTPDATTEVFRDTFDRKYFTRDYEKIQGGMMTEKSLNYTDPIMHDTRNFNLNYTTNRVGYYFDIYKDYEINEQEACKAVEVYNKQAYYIDLDFDCESVATTDPVYIDIYGPATEPEVCP